VSYDAVVFDFDGVLVEPTESSVLETAAENAFEALGVDPSKEDVETFAGSVTPEKIRAVGRRRDVDPDRLWRRREHDASLAQRVQARLGRKPPYDDIDALSALDRPTGVVSANQHATVEWILSHFGLDGFETVYGREPSIRGVERKKPNPHYVDLAFSDLDSETPLYVGDNPSDVVAADRAGADSAFVRRPHRVDFDLSVYDADPTYDVDGLEDIVDIVHEHR
jgi:HAD superfamily hydrolase (TIGR01549 family)